MRLKVMKRRGDLSSGLRTFSLVVCLCAVVFLLLFRPVSAERLTVKTYTVADGLLRDSVVKINQDSRGFLWLCSAEGISRFDGYAFTNFTTNDGLPDRHVNDFLETKSGQIYLATDKGLVRLNPTGLANAKNNPLFTVILPDDPRAKGIQVLFEDESGIVWVGTSDGLYKLNAQGGLEAADLGKLLKGPDKTQITTIIKDVHGAMWIGTNENGLLRLLPNGEVEQFTHENGLPGDNVASLLESKSGRIWVGMRPGKFEDGLCLLVAAPRKDQNIVERVFTAKDGLPSTWIPDLYEDDDKFWVATTRGLCQWQGCEKSVCKTYTSKNDLCDQDVWSITEDDDKNLWVGSLCGVKKWGRYGFTSYSESDGTGFPTINSIFENTAGELFSSFSTGTSRYVSRFDGKAFDLVKPNFPLSVNYAGWGWKQTVWQDRAGDWWFPTGNGLFWFPVSASFEDLAKATPTKVETGAKSQEVFRIFEDLRGDIWIATTGTANELLRWERSTNTWHNFTGELNLSPNRLYMGFVEDKEGNLWISTGADDDESALIRYREVHFKIFTVADDVPACWILDSFIDHS